MTEYWISILPAAVAGVWPSYDSRITLGVSLARILAVDHQMSNRTTNGE